MDIGLTSLVLLGYCLFLGRLMRWPIEVLPFFVISLAIVCLYAFGYAGLMQEGAFALLAIGSIFLVASPLYLTNFRKDFFVKYCTPGIFSYLFFLVLLSIFLNTSVVVGSDDYGKWLDHAKIIFFKNSFVSLQYDTASPDYPPGGALLGYLFMQLGGYQDEKLFFVQEILLLTPLLLVLKQYTWQKWFDAFILFFILLLSLMFVFGVPLGPKISLMMDIPLGSYFGAVVASYYLLNKEKFLWIYLLIPTMAMTIFRPIAFPFVLVIFVIILLDQYLLYQFKDSDKQTKTTILGFFTLVLGSALILYSWQRYMHNAAINTPWCLTDLLAAVFHKTSFLSAQDFLLEIKNFTKIFMQFLLFPFFLLLFLGFLLYHSENSLLRYRIILSQLILFAAFLIYSLMFLMVFLYLSQSMNETITIISFRRFWFTFIIGWVIILLAQLEIILGKPYCLSQFSDMLNIKIVIFKKSIDEYFFGKIVNNKTLLTVFLLLLFYCYLNATVSGFHTHIGANRNWQYVRRIVSKNITLQIIELTAPQSRIGVIMNSNFPEGFFINALKFELLPRFTYIYQPVFGSKSYFEQAIKKLDYVFLMNIDNQFWLGFNSYFVPKDMENPATCIMDSSNKFSCNTILYKVNQQDGKLYLTRMSTNHINF